MNRSVVLAFVLLAAGAGCNNPVCGPGTKQHQKSNGDVECVPSEAGPAEIDCDVDGGATIVAGHCVSASTCGPNTTLMNGQCVGNGGGGVPHVPDACPTPATGKICINGVVRHLVNNSFLDKGEMVRVAVYAPLDFLANPATPPLAEAQTDDTYTIKDISPAGPLIAVAISDPIGTTTQVLQITGTGAIVSPGLSYQIDTYATPKALVDMWHAQTGDDYDGSGAYVVKFYLDAAPAANMLTATETMPASGVTVYQDGSLAARAKFFSTDFMTIGSDSATTSIGAAILVGDGQLSQYTGMGNTPGAKWETHSGSTTGKVVFVDRYHPCNQDAMGNCTM